SRKSATAKSRAACEQLLGMTRTAGTLLQHRMKEIADCVKGLSTPPRFAPCSIADVVSSVVSTLSALAAERAIALQVRGVDALPQIEADERRLFNCFYNLVDNALDEVPHGGAVTIAGEGVLLG